MGLGTGQSDSKGRSKYPYFQVIFYQEGQIKESKVGRPSFANVGEQSLRYLSSGSNAKFQ